MSEPRSYVRITSWYQTGGNKGTQRVPKGTTVYGVLDGSETFNVIRTAAGIEMMRAADDDGGKGWHFDDGDQVTRITYDQLSDEAIAALAVAVLLGEDDG